MEKCAARSGVEQGGGLWPPGGASIDNEATARCPDSTSGRHKAHNATTLAVRHLKSKRAGPCIPKPNAWIVWSP